MRIAMVSQDASKPQIGGKSAAIMKICELLRKLQSLLDFAINSAIAESQNSGGTDQHASSGSTSMFPKKWRKFFKQAQFDSGFTLLYFLVI